MNVSYVESFEEKRYQTSLDVADDLAAYAERHGLTIGEARDELRDPDSISSDLRRLLVRRATGE
ncbi:MULTISPECIES: hypothetical protein [Pandoraea]|uniref:hypothetical protein n=1 Tax=Pandoraea TaxID=93217 RepID=UPI0003D226E5|nr:MULTISPECIES: hypothetical protein [Pandoraea]AHB78698.1 hypothetical protein X636_20600 [Pandoraea pnomenusa]